MTIYAQWLEGMISSKAALLTVFAFMLSSWGLGDLFLSHILKLKWRNRAFKPLVSTVAGMNIWALIGFLLGWLGLLSERNSKFMLATLAVLSAGHLLSQLNKQNIRVIPPVSVLKKNSFFFILIGVAFVFFLGNYLCPPAGIGLDEQTYHLPIPLRWIRDGFFHVYADIPYSGYPSLPEFILSIVMGAGKSSAPRVLILCVHMLNALLLYFLLRRYGGAIMSTVLTAALFLAGSHMNFMYEVYVECFIVASFLSGLAILHSADLRGIEIQRFLSLKIAGVCGFFGACALAVKLTAMPVSVILFFAAVIIIGHKRIKHILCGTAIAYVIFALPFYLRTWLITGNPLWPYYGWIFSDEQSVIETSRLFHMMGDSNSFGKGGMPEALMSPFLLCWNDVAFDGEWGLQFGAFIIFAAVGTYLLLKSKTASPIKYMNIGGFIFAYIFWMCTSRQSRFLEPAVILLVFASADALRHMRRDMRMLGLALILALALLSSPWGWVGHYITTWKVVLNKVPPYNFLSATLGKSRCEAYTKLASISGPKDKVMIIYDRKILHCPVDCFIATPFYQERFFTPPPEEGTDAEIQDKILKTMQFSGAKYVMAGLNLDGVDMNPAVFPRTEKFRNALSALLSNGRLKTIWGSPDFIIAEIPR